MRSMHSFNVQGQRGSKPRRAAHLGLLLTWFVILAPAAWAQRDKPASVVEGPAVATPMTLTTGSGKQQQIIKLVPYRINEGLLVLDTTPGARVRLSLAKAGARVVFDDHADASGLLLVGKLKPGAYKVDIEHPDYLPHAETKIIGTDKPSQISHPLVAKYGTLTLGLGSLAAPDVTVTLNGKALEPAQCKLENGKLIVTRVPVGVYQVIISKPGYDDWRRDVCEVKPGAVDDNDWPITLQRAVIALTIKTLPGAQVYVDDVSRGLAAETGLLAVSDLLPGAHRVSVQIFGCETATQDLTLTLDQRQLTKEFKLESIVERAEAKEDFNPASDKWYSPVPRAWQIDAGRGLKVKGAEVALFRHLNLPNRRFNIYDDFTLRFKVRLGQGVAWIARARDEKNYVLCELTPPQGGKGRPRFSYTFVRDGKADPHDEEVFLPFGKPDEELTITLEAEGDQLKHFIDIPSDPKDKAQPLGRPVPLTDNIFSKGGVGLCARHGEMYISQFLVIPKVKQSASK